MHACLNVDEIVRLIACELVACGRKGTAVAFACCCKGFEDPVLDALWETQDQFHPLLGSFPEDVWDGDNGKFVSALTTFHLLFAHEGIFVGRLSRESQLQWNGSTSRSTLEGSALSKYITLRSSHPQRCSRCCNTEPSAHLYSRI